MSLRQRPVRLLTTTLVVFLWSTALSPAHAQADNILEPTTSSASVLLSDDPSISATGTVLFPVIPLPASASTSSVSTSSVSTSSDSAIAQTEPGSTPKAAPFDPAAGALPSSSPNPSGSLPSTASAPVPTVVTESSPLVSSASLAEGVASGPPQLFMPALGSSTCCPSDIKRQFSGADDDPFQVRTPVEWHVVFMKIVGLFPPGVPFFRLGKMINFFSVDPSLDPNQCWGPCKEAVFADFHASPTAHLPPEPSMPTITLPTMQTLLESGVPLSLLDAREHFAGFPEKLPQAIGMRPSITADEAARLLPDKQRMIIVYGAHPEDPSGKELARALRSFGYATVIEFRDGLTAWKKAGLPLETIEAGHEGSR